MICLQRGTCDAGNKREDLMFYGFLEPSGINKHNLYLNRLKYSDILNTSHLNHVSYNTITLT